MGTRPTVQPWEKGEGDEVPERDNVDEEACEGLACEADNVPLSPPPRHSGRVPPGHDTGNSADEQEAGGYSGDVADLPGQGGHPGQADRGVGVLWFLAWM
jgi:hypothetical protein